MTLTDASVGLRGSASCTHSRTHAHGRARAHTHTQRFGVATRIKVILEHLLQVAAPAHARPPPFPSRATTGSLGPAQPSPVSESRPCPARSGTALPLSDQAGPELGLGPRLIGFAQAALGAGQRRTPPSPARPGAGPDVAARNGARKESRACAPCAPRVGVCAPVNARRAAGPMN